MIVWHVCSAKKLNKYLHSKQINAPVRAWDNIQQAERMSLSTGRKVILRLKFPDDTSKLEGHFGKARILHTDYRFKDY